MVVSRIYKIYNTSICQNLNRYNINISDIIVKSHIYIRYNIDVSRVFAYNRYNINISDIIVIYRTYIRYNIIISNIL